MVDKVDNNYYHKVDDFMGSICDETDNQDSNINNNMHARECMGTCIIHQYL